MVTAGSTNPERSKVSAHEIGYRTALALSRTVPPALVGVTVIFYLEYYSSFQEDNLKKKLHLIWMKWTSLQLLENHGHLHFLMEEHFKTVQLKHGQEKLKM